MNCESPACVVLPSTAWSFHKLHVDELRNVVFFELRRVREPQCIVDTSHIVTWKLVQLDQDMKVNVVLGVSREVSTIEDIRILLGNLERLHLCGGGPTTN